MNNQCNVKSSKIKKKTRESKEEKKKEDKELDRRLKDTFPASDSTAEY